MENAAMGGHQVRGKFPQRFPVTFLKFSFVIAVFLLTFIITPAYAAKNVIVLIIDGLRNDEAFDDPIHQYIPHIWNDLRPQGTININFWNTGITSTTAGHNQIVTGMRGIIDYNENASSPEIHSKYPNIFEYYRKQKNIPEEKVWFIAGKGIITKSVHRSLHPDYANFSARSESLNRSDNKTWASVKKKMNMYHPNLMVITLRDVDETAHQGNYVNYTNAIRVADQIVYDLWQQVQSTPYYKDETDLIITTDHGRNSDGYSKGFVDHGERNHGNRHIAFLAVGPDFKQNEVIDIRRDQIDIVPTIGAILGVQTPYADGGVMTELFRNPDIGSSIVTGGQRRTSLSASSTGLHAVWSQKNGEEWDIYYKKSSDEGNTWTEPTKLFESGQDDNYFYEAEITSQDNGLVYVAAVGYSLINEGGSTYSWGVFGRRSLDGGNTWGNVEKLKDVKALALNPSITSKGDNVLISYSCRIENFQILLNSLYSSNQGGRFYSRVITDKIKTQGPSYSSLGHDQNRFYALWSYERANSIYPYWNVFFDRAYINPLSWGTDKVITSNTSNKMEFYTNNSVTANNNGSLKLLITKREDTTDNNGQVIAGKWKTLLKSSSDSGDTFSEEPDFYDSATCEAWNPKVSFTDPATQNTILVWEQHYNGSGAEIYGRKKAADEWQDIFSVSSSDGRDSAEPDLATYNGNAYVGWQDYESGNWLIKVQKTD